MPDPIRVGLFLLSLGALLTTSVALISPLRLGGAATLLALWVVAAGQVVLLGEVLSLLHALEWPGFLVGHLLVLGATAAWAWRRPPAQRWRAVDEIEEGIAGLLPIVRDWRRPALPLLAGVTLVTGLVSLALALWAPPNSLDSLSYHLSRVGYYLQFRSLDHYPTIDPRQAIYPIDSELLVLWTVAFLRSERLLNTVQLASWVLTAVAVYGIGREVGFGPRGALFAAGMFALLPAAVLQSTNTMNDLVVASFVAASLLFLLKASGQRAVGSEQRTDAPAHAPLPMARSLVLAGAAAGLAVGTKGTTLLALPTLAVAVLVFFARRLERRVLAGLLLGGVAAVLLGSYIYIQNWFVYGSLSGPPPLALASGASGKTWENFVANLARTLFQFVFADLSGPLANARLQWLRDPLAYGLGTAGEWLFAAFGIPTVVEGMDREWWPKFNFFRATRVNEIFSGIGPIGGLMLVFALAALLWPGRVPPSRRLLGFGALSYLVLMTLTLRWSPYAAGRFLLIACAFAAPLLGALLAGPKSRSRPASVEDVGSPMSAGRVLTSARPRWWREGLAVLLVVWGGVTGLYVATFNEDRPLARLGERDRIGLMTLRYPNLQNFFRELEQELGPTAAVGVYGAIDPLSGQGGQWQYPLFGPRFTRTVLPLVPDGYFQRPAFKRPLPWSNETLVNTYPPAYIVVESPRSSGDQELPQLIPGRCFPVPLVHGKPTVPWELWRCQDRDPRSVLQNGDFRAWPETVGAPPIGWEAEVADQAGLVVSRLDPNVGPGEEPFHLRLDYRAGRRGGEAGIVQEVPLDGLRGRVLMVDARLLADRAGAVLLSVDDGETVTEIMNQSSEAETLRVEHPVHPAATELLIRFQASEAGRDAVVLVRTILAIPWEIGTGPPTSDG